MTEPKPLKTDSSVEESQNDAGLRKAKGEFVRGISKFRSELGEDPDFPPESGRYHLFVAFNCPWCHRVTLARNALGLEASVTMDVAFPNRTDEDDPAGASLWEFNPVRPATLTGAPLPECTVESGTGEGYRLVKQIYEAEGSDETSVPVLYDKQSKRIVSNESAEIVRMLNREASKLGSSLFDKARPNLYPTGDDNAELRAMIDALNDQIYININNGA
jgi:glutathionyl-hydroquinone reductase